MKATKRFLLQSFTIGAVIGLSSCLSTQKSHLEKTPTILINQIGYLPQFPKIAFLKNHKTGSDKKIQLVDIHTGKVVHRIAPDSPNPEKTSGEDIRALDFSEYKKEGRYVLRLGPHQSFPFSIGTKIYEQPLKQLLRSYYLQRCGVALEDPITGINHPACHTKDGLLARTNSLPNQPKERARQRPCAGGWHDAGDYGKYMAPGAIAAARLLSIYEVAPALFDDLDLSIPESNNTIPDILDEIRVEVEWFLTMQRPDGAVYRKLSGSKWPMGLSPHEDIQPRWIYGVSTPETAKFAAVMAMFERNYRKHSPSFSQTCLKAALKAWKYLESQPTMKVDWQSGDDSGSGKYLYSKIDTEESLKTDIDDRLWAATELWISTGQTEFKSFILKTYSSFSFTLFEWKDPSALALTNLLFHPQAKPLSKTHPSIRHALFTRSKKLLKAVSSSGYRLANHRFIWGSNKMAAEEGITLFLTYKQNHDLRYLKASIDQMNYLLGQNPFQLCYVSGMGSKPVRHVNHLFSRAAKLSIPGLLVGGPNSEAQDNIAPKRKGILSYVDDERSYATNEYAIDYNASLIALMGMLMNEASIMTTKNLN